VIFHLPAQPRRIQPSTSDQLAILDFF